MSTPRQQPGQGDGELIRSDRFTLTVGDRVVGYMKPLASSFTLAWLASHRDRLHTLILGGHRLTVLVVWDTKGQQRVERDDAEVDCLAHIVFGPKVEADRA